MWVAGSVQRRFWGGSEGRRSRLEVVASQVCLREAGDDVHQGGVVGTLITMSRVTIAASSHLAAEAGAAMADSGGNAVDAAVAATITAMTTEPGIIAPRWVVFRGDLAARR